MSRSAPHSPALQDEPVAPVDAAWLAMEDPTNLMMITAALIFDELPSDQALLERIEHRILPHVRFRQRVVKRALGGSRWELDPTFDLRAHVHRVALPRPGGALALGELIGDLMSTPLDLTKPLWQLHVIEDGTGGGALVARIQHALGDGMALTRILLSLADQDVEAPEATVLPAAPKVAPEPPDLLRDGLELILHPAQLLELTKQATAMAGSLGRAVLLPADPATSFKGKLGTVKRAAWSSAIPLARLKSIARAVGGTVNDVLMAAVAGAARHYLEMRAMPVRDLQIRAVVPVDLRTNGNDDLGNHFGLVFVPLPLGTCAPLERLRAVKHTLDEIKASPEATVMLHLLGAAGIAGVEVERTLLELFGKKASLVATNVPGPRRSLFVAGRRIKRILVWVPQSGRLGLGVSLLSYAGEVTVGVATDAGLIPDPESLVTDFERELDALEAAVHQAGVTVLPLSPEYTAQGERRHRERTHAE